MKTHAQGMTLLELMMALAVLGILLAVGVPAFRSFTNNSRVTAVTNDLVTAMATARSEALHRSTFTRMCSSTDQATCSGDPNWATGWVVFADNNNDGVVDADELIQSWPGVTGSVTVTAAGATAVGYTPMGTNSSVAVTFTVIPPNCTGNQQGQTTISTVGSVSSTTLACP